MKTKDIMVGQDYAVEIYPGEFRQYTVIEIADHTRKVFSNYRWDVGGHTSTSKMVHIQSATAEEWVMPAKIHKPWSEFAEIDAAKRTAEKTQEQRFKKAEQALAERDIRYARFERWVKASNYGCVRLSISDIEKLLQLPEA